MDNSSLAERIWAIFARPTPPQRKAFIAQMDSLPEEARIRLFSPFNEGHMERVQQVRERWNRLAPPAAGEKGLNEVLDDYESLRGRENPDLLYFALEVFLTHYRGELTLVLPSILVREPELIGPTEKQEPEPGGGFSLKVAKGSPEETKMDWFREDPLLNEHHAHWHVVYYTRDVYDRQGEMFFYMHRQMLARYDAERIGLGVKRVLPFSDMTKPIEVGYTAGADERLSQYIGGDREVDAQVVPEEAQTQLDLRKALVSDIDNGVFDLRPGTVDEMKRETDALNTLGSTVEANKNPQCLDKPYRSYHGAGHNWIGSLNNGVMFSTATAIRDVVFWEWHKEVDGHYERLQERFDPYEFHKDAPPVTLRSGSNEDGEPDSMDIILCNSASLPGFGEEGFDGTALGKEAFGNGSWDKEFGSGSFKLTNGKGHAKNIDTTDTLITNRNFGTVAYEADGQKKSYQFEYINHEPFCYFIRVQNNAQQLKQVTVRVFIAPDSVREDRSMWIELDKFLHELAPGRNVIFRSDDDVSVIRKPALKNPSEYAVDYDPVLSPGKEDAKCKCGWPYHLLLPKGDGSGRGAAYKLVVMLSDGGKDAIQKEDGCGSLSFCAARNEEYPDKRPLGYPFNRRFKGSIMNTVTTQPNFACRSIYIKHMAK